MPNVNDLKSSKFLTKHDVEPPILVTIKSYESLNVAMESQSEEVKWCLNFNEVDKPLVLNMTNGQLISAIIGSGDFDHWIGKEIVLYNDRTVMFAGKLTGGIRVRAKKGGQVNPEHNPPVTDEEPICPDCGQPSKNGCECVPF
jgi:hypothetical protein